MKTKVNRNELIKLHALVLTLLFSHAAFSACGKSEPDILILPDGTAPVTTASPAGGSYGKVQYVKLASSEAATIYYSLDGADPTEGASNTVSGTSPLFWIHIDSGTTVLKFFAVDGTGHREPVKTETYIVTIPPTPYPVANAGPDQNVATKLPVTLLGSGSAANGVNPTFRWSFSSKPDGSIATLSSTTVAKPTFTPDKDGAYVLSLVVNDGQIDSAADTVMITALNSIPVANAGPDQNIVKGSLVTLDGSGSSDVNGDALTYNWSFTSVPAGSTAMLSDATVVNTTFTADLDGSYGVSLVVNDGQVSSVADTVVITVFTPVYPPHSFSFDDGTLQGWTTYGSWGVTTLYAHSGGYSMTDSPGGSYPSYSNTSLVSPLIDLTGTSNPTLTFYHRYSLETNYDYGMVEISSNGGSTFSPYVQRFTGGLANFTLVTINLSAYKSFNKVVIRFRLTSDSIVNYDGWYVDDIVISQ